LILEKAEKRKTAWAVRENQEIYEVKPGRKKLQWANIAVYSQFIVKLKVKVVPVNGLDSRSKATPKPCRELK